MTTIALFNKELVSVRIDISDLEEILETVSYDDSNYIYSSTFRTLANIKNENDLFILTTLVKNSIISLDDINVNDIGNPIYNSYKKWERTWRKNSSNSAYEWRESTRIFVNVHDLITKDELSEYMNELEDIHCIVYDRNETSEDTVTKMLVDNKRAVRDSKFINSMGRHDLQTRVVGTKVEIK
jgi:hypothetical protein